MRMHSKGTFYSAFTHFHDEAQEFTQESLVVVLAYHRACNPPWLEHRLERSREAIDADSKESTDWTQLPIHQTL